MHFAFSRNHALMLGVSIVCAAFVSGCDKNQGKPAPAMPAPPVINPVAPPGAASAAGGAPDIGKMSSVPVKGDEPLPPNHPPISALKQPPQAGGMPGGMPTGHPGGTPGAMPGGHPGGAPGAVPGGDTNINKQLASQHPKSDSKKKLAVVVPDSVKGKWSAVTITVAAGGAEKENKVAIGEKIALGNGMQLHVVHYLPAYTSDFKTVTSASNEQLNPAIMVEAIANGKVVAEGWVFQNLPDFNSFVSDKVKVRLVSAERKK